MNENQLRLEVAKNIQHVTVMARRAVADHVSSPAEMSDDELIKALSNDLGALLGALEETNLFSHWMVMTTSASVSETERIMGWAAELAQTIRKRRE
jgi:RNase P/RNase MRP subunit POP5